jgi:hypothetical protein
MTVPSLWREAPRILRVQQSGSSPYGRKPTPRSKVRSEWREQIRALEVSAAMRK